MPLKPQLGPDLPLISLEELSAFLYSESIHVEFSFKHTQTTEILFAYSATRGYRGSRGRGYSTRGRGGYRGPSSHPGSQPSSFPTRGGHQYPRDQYRRDQRGGRSGHNSSSVICQICGKTNHSALDC